MGKKVGDPYLHPKQEMIEVPGKRVSINGKVWCFGTPEEATAFVEAASKVRIIKSAKREV